MHKTLTRFALPLGVAGLAVAAYWAARKPASSHPPDSAPGRTARQTWFGDYVVGGRSVTIAAEPEPLFAIWRDPSQLSRFMRHVQSVEAAEDGTWRWVLRGPAEAEVTLLTRIVTERASELIAWRSVEGSEIEAEGKVMFRKAPAGRGTVVEAVIAYQPPGGTMGHWMAKAFGTDPARLGRHELKRLKMLMETGEIATASPPAQKGH
ncbi:MAG: SRPBCC family protein [Gemmobacter sp.]|uniref:SRPBCC family protein n=1 Tax=Gemmobacter sp. TaxID=1898957 RepID=UPI001A4D6D9A|nr:SRPBCC family protein [Gemmobacter sp.]MBL8563278.1 SRPBCC family protein [Gemmobacter sp.]